MNHKELQNRSRGSLVAGATGDALGYPVEFLGQYDEITAKYGEAGITEYDLSYPWLENELYQNFALISDDTQMTLYTAYGLLNAEMEHKPEAPCVCNAYLHWFGKQVGRKIKAYPCWLVQIPRLNQRRAPGNTCLTSLLDIYNGKEPMNNSKGCGAVIRIAPVGIYGATHGWSLAKTAETSAEIGDITHQHSMSKYSCALMSVLIQLCMNRQEKANLTEWLIKTIEEALEISRHLSNEEDLFIEFEKLIRKAICLHDNPLSDYEIIENELGGGWIAEETLAIAIFSVLRHIDNVGDCLVCAINHGGDSDSTGAVAGNLIGAVLGYDAIPAKYLDKLELRDVIETIADDLCADPECPADTEHLKKRYKEHLPYAIPPNYMS